MSHILLHFAALPAPTITIDRDGFEELGEQNVLTCTLSTIEGLIASAEILIDWLDESDDLVTAAGTSVGNLEGGGSSFRRDLRFSTLKTSHAAVYVCRASITVPELSVTQSGIKPYSLTLRSKNTVHVFAFIFGVFKILECCYWYNSCSYTLGFECGKIHYYFKSTLIR